MSGTYRFFSTVSATAILAAASPAFAAGTQSGQTVTNTVSVAYQVGGVVQTAETATDAFTVDRKVSLVVAEVGSTTTQVSPGEVQAVTAFTVTNTSNDTLDFALTAAQQTGGAGAHSNTDNFDASNVRIYRDVNGDGLLDGGDTLVTYLDEIGPDASERVLVVVDISSSQVTGDVAAITLTATSHASGSIGSQGALLMQTSGANTAGVDTVFADAAGDTDSVRDGAHSAKDDYTILAAALSANKTSVIISDPQNGTTNPKAIPGAVIEYCIAVANSAGTTATNVVVSDPVPGDLTFVAGSIRVDGTVSSGVCQADGVAGGSYSGTTVSGALTDIAVGVERTLVFRATVN